MRQLPCKADKCLVYPSCKSKKVIYCLPLFMWVGYQGHTDDTWDYMKQYLTNVKKIKFEENVRNGTIEYIERKDR